MVSDPTTPRRISYTILLMLLVAAALTLGAMLAVTTRGALHAADDQTRKGMLRYAYVSLALLGFCLVMLVWVLVRYLRFRSRPRGRRQRTAYDDAWALAGKRYKVEDGPEELREGLEGEPDDDEPE